MKKTTYTISIDQELLETCRRYAKATGRTTSNCISYILTLGLARPETPPNVLKYGEPK